MITHKDSELIAEFCQAKLDLANAKLSDEYYYTSLPLCVIDAVFSIGVTYSSTRLTGTCKLLSHEYPHLTLRSLDHLIWNYQRAMPEKPTNELKKKRNCNRNIEP